MNIITSEDMRLLDHRAIHEFSISSLQLMLEAARQLKEYIDQQYQKDASILIVCGPGNNGGDGFALSTLLASDQYENMHVVCNAEEAHMSHDESFYAQKARQMNVSITSQRDEKAFLKMCKSSDLIVDALFGNGLSRSITNTYEMLIRVMNESRKPILSADIASGIHSDTGQVMGCAIKACTTITFTCATCGHMIYPGSMYCGHIIVKPIGIPKEAFENINLYPMIDASIARAFLPRRYAHSHKGSYGKALMIGGSTSMHGAITLAAMSMLRSGVGMLTLFIPDCISTILSMKMEACMLLESKSINGFFAPTAPKQLTQCLANYDTLVIGNGMGRSKVGEELVKIAIESKQACVIDGDAIYELAQQLELLKQHEADIIITPHPKEMSYLTGKSVEYIVKHPFEIVKEFALMYHVVVVLKDQYTYISDGKDVYVNTCGNHALAKGGSGDVLCGIVAGLFAQSKNAFHAAICGVYVHAKCADNLLKKEDGNSILPNDLIHELSSVYRSLR